MQETARPRPGEELDPVRVRDFLAQALPAYSGQPEIRQFPGGASNLTYLIRIGDQELVLRRPPFGTKARSAHDMGARIPGAEPSAQRIPLQPAAVGAV